MSRIRDARSDVFAWMVGAASGLLVTTVAAIFLPLFRCGDLPHFYSIVTNITIPGQPIVDARPVSCPRCGDAGRYSLFAKWRLRAYERSTLVY